MKIAVTNHAVDRYMERVDGAKGFARESVRSIIRKLVEDGFQEGAVRDHPFDTARRIVPFASGATILYLSIGPNITTYEADLAVIGVLFEKEVTNGKQWLGAKVGDLELPADLGERTKETAPKYTVFIGSEPTIEFYRRNTLPEIDELVEKRGADRSQVRIYKLIE